MPTKHGGTIYVAKRSFITVIDGVEVTIQQGRTRVREGHPLLSGRMEMFEPMTVDYEMEQATAGPGEKRR